MSDYSGNIRQLREFHSDLQVYVRKDRSEIAQVTQKSRESLGRVRDGAVSGAINDFIRDYEIIDQYLADLIDGGGAGLDAMIKRFEAAKKVWDGTQYDKHR